MSAEDAFVEFMEETFGRRDPECVWCGATVHMTSQALFAGGVWTTEEAHEGPARGGAWLTGPGTRCSESPDGEHSCFATEKWLGEEAGG
jgi:hypothetical protein